MLCIKFCIWKKKQHIGSKILKFFYWITNCTHLKKNKSNYSYYYYYYPWQLINCGFNIYYRKSPNKLITKLPESLRFFRGFCINFKIVCKQEIQLIKIVKLYLAGSNMPLFSNYKYKLVIYIFFCFININYHFSDFCVYYYYKFSLRAKFHTCRVVSTL